MNRGFGHLTSFKLLATLAFMFVSAPVPAQQGLALTDDEVYALASAQYYEMQKAAVDGCKTRFGVDHRDVMNQFDSRYGEFFRAKIVEAKSIVSRMPLSWAKFVEGTTYATRMSLSSGFCSQIRAAFTNRVQNLDTVERGLNNQFNGLRAEFQRK